MKELDASHISSLCHGFFESRLLLSAVEMDLFTLLAGKWLSCEQIAGPRGWDPFALRVMLDALVVSGLLVRRGTDYSTTEISGAYLASDGEFSIREQALVGSSLWVKWGQLTDRIVGSGVLGTRDDISHAIGAMNRVSPRFAPGIAALVRPELSHSVLDVGAGSGAYSVAFLRRDRSLAVTIFERPEVLRLCVEYLRVGEFEDSVRLVEGDYRCDEFPPDQGMVFLSPGIADLSRQSISDLLQRCYRAIRPAGRLVIRDYIMTPDRLQPREGAMHAVSTLVGTNGNGPYTFPEVRQMLEEAGFVDVRLLQAGEHMNSVVEAYRPEH